jgi:hypothetical protein
MLAFDMISASSNFRREPQRLQSLSALGGSAVGGIISNERFAMNDIFERRVQSAAVGAWWTLLIAAIFLSLQWIIYLLVVSAQPARLLSLQGCMACW